MTLKILCMTLLFLLIFIEPAMAHDCWLQPQNFWPAQGALLALQLFVGDRIAPDKELPLQRELTRNFGLFTGDERRDLLPETADGFMPLLSLEMESDGPVLFSMERDFTHITLTDEQFSGYLEHERMTEAIRLRNETGRKEEERERYARHMKSLIRTGSGLGEDLHDRVVGQRLEIVLLDSPWGIGEKGVLRVRILFEGSPLKEKSVTAYGKGPAGNVVAVSSKTDARGVAPLELTGPGMWMVRLVHLFPCSESSVAEWESHWGSYSFEIPAL